MKFGSVIVCVLTLISCNKSESTFDFISVTQSIVTTTHRLPISLKLQNDFEPFGEHDFVESYDGVPFKVSTATFLSSNKMIILLAEEHLDPKGLFTYDLPMDTLNGMNVYRRVGCFNLFEETEEDLGENVYLRFLKSKEFDFQQWLNMVQFILLNDEKSAEVVLSYVELYPECPEESDNKNLTLKAKNILSDFNLLNE